MQRLHGYLQRCSRWTQENLNTRRFGFQLLWTSFSRGLLRMVFLSQFALESVFAHSRTIELPHDKAVFLNEIKNGLFLVGNPLEPLVLVNVTLDNVYLSIQNIMEMFAFVEHG
jgi:hypothetical protein